MSIRCVFLRFSFYCSFFFFFSLHQVYCPVNCGTGTRKKKIKEFLTFQNNKNKIKRKKERKKISSFPVPQCGREKRTVNRRVNRAEHHKRQTLAHEQEDRSRGLYGCEARGGLCRGGHGSYQEAEESGE